MASQPDEFSPDYVAMDDPDLVPTNGEMISHSKNPKIGKIGMSFSTNSSGQIEFSMRNISGHEFVFPGNDKEKKVAYIGIRDHSIIEIELSNATDWEFDPNSELLSTKSVMHRKYYHVRRSRDGKPLKNIVLHATPTGDLNQDGQSHPFNIFLLFGQKYGHKLPVIIDPDIKNPPPHSLLETDPVAQNTPVPML